MLTCKRMFPDGFPSGKLFPFNKDTNQCYARVLSAVVWPSEQPGFAVVLGEEFNCRETKYHLLSEFQSTDLATLLKSCVQLKVEFQISSFYAPPDERVFNYLESHFNRKQRKLDNPMFRFQPPPFYDAGGNVTYHLNILKTVLEPGAKRLVLAEHSLLPGMLSALPLSIANVIDKDIPGPAALAYALAAFEVFPFSYLPPQKSQEYDPLTYR